MSGQNNICAGAADIQRTYRKFGAICVDYTSKCAEASRSHEW
jgi:hypothetical protein